LLCNFSQRILIGLIDCEIQQDLTFFQVVGQLVEVFNFTGNGCALFQDGFGFFRLVPESIFDDNLFDFSQAFFFARNVKDSLAGLTVFVRDPLRFV
jgi:hypothetical protein